MIEATGTRLWMVHFYQEQLKKFEKLGLNNKTDCGVKITPELIAITEKRLEQLTVVYDANLTDQAKYARLRTVMLRRSQLKGQLNDKSTGIKSSKVKKRKNLRNDGHEGGEA